MPAGSPQLKKLHFQNYDLPDHVDNGVDDNFDLGELITCRQAFGLQLLSFFTNDLLGVSALGPNCIFAHFLSFTSLFSRQVKVYLHKA